MSENKININPGGKIKADNTVVGTQVSGVSAEDAAKLAGASRDKNELNLGEGATLDTGTLVAGFQFIGNPAAATPDSLRHDIELLRKKLDEVLADASLKDNGDAEDVRDEIRKADEAMAKGDTKRAVGKLEAVRQKLESLTQVVTQSTALGAALVALSTVATSLVAIGTKLFGG